jgi:hypothetical protein
MRTSPSQAASGGEKNLYKSNKSSSEITLLREALHVYREIYDE